MDIGEVLRAFREKRGWTQAQLGVYAGVAPSAVSQIESGRRSPNTNTLLKLAKSLNVEVGDLFTEESAEPREEELVVDLSDAGFTALQERADIDPESLRGEVAESEEVYERAIAHSTSKADFDMERGGYAARLAALAQAEGGDFEATRRAIVRALSTAEKAFMREFARAHIRLREREG